MKKLGTLVFEYKDEDGEDSRGYSETNSMLKRVRFNGKIVWRGGMNEVIDPYEGIILKLFKVKE